MPQPLIQRARPLILPSRGFRKPVRPAIDVKDAINGQLSGCWLLGDVGPSGLTLDISGNGNHGTLTNSPALTGSHHGGRALSFNGSTSFVSIPASGLLAASAISVSAWVKFTALTNAYSSVFSLALTGGAVHQLLVKSNGKLAVFVKTTAGNLSYDGTGSHTLVTGQWYQLGFSYDGHSGFGLVGIVNGEVDATVGPVNPLTTTSSLITTIGKDNNTAGRIVNGAIEGARQWGRAITSAEWRRLVAEPYAGILETAPRSRTTQQRTAVSASAAFTGAGVLAPHSMSLFPAHVAFVGSGVFSPQKTILAPRSAALSASGALVAVDHVAVRVAASFAGSGAFSARPGAMVSASFRGVGVFAPHPVHVPTDVQFTASANFAPIAGKSADLAWPINLFIPRTPEVRLAGMTVGGGRSLTGKLQEVAADSGFWLITLGNIPIRTNSEILQWRELEGLLEGRLNTALVPVYDSKRAPWPGGVPDATITATMSGAVLAGATSGSIDMSAGAAPQAGMFFSSGERLYRLKSVDAPTLTVYPVTFLPPVREDIANGAPLEFAHPVCRCRLRSDDGMSLPLDLQKFAVKSVEFEEDV